MSRGFNAAPFAPSEKLPGRLSISRSGISIAYVGHEEFDKAPAGRFAGTDAGDPLVTMRPDDLGNLGAGHILASDIQASETPCVNQLLRYGTMAETYILSKYWVRWLNQLTPDNRGVYNFDDVPQTNLNDLEKGQLAPLGPIWEGHRRHRAPYRTPCESEEALFWRQSATCGRLKWTTV